MTVVESIRRLDSEGVPGGREIARRLGGVSRDSVSKYAGGRRISRRPSRRRFAVRGRWCWPGWRR